MLKLDEAPPALSAQALSPQSAPTTARTLLLVDDDLPLLGRLARAMEKRGFVVTTADTVAEATALATSLKPDYAVVDLRLSDGNGLDVVAALRAARSDVRVVMLTGYGAIATAVAAVKAGAVDYLPKPTGPCRRRRTCPCPPSACAGSIFSGCSNSASATSLKPPAVCVCTAARCNASSPSTLLAARRAD
jgi:CheY-like chemotaxis protein